MESLISEIASRTGVQEDVVRAVLEQLGLGDTIDRIRATIGEGAVESLTIDDLAVSARVSGLIVAR